MSFYAKFYNYKLLLLSVFPVLTGCVSMGLSGLEAFTVGATATTAVVVTADINNKNTIKIYGNYNDEKGYWFNKDKFYIHVVAESQIESERIAKELSRGSCHKRGKLFLILKLQNDRLKPPAVSILDSKYATDIQFECISEAARPDPFSIYVTTEDKDSSERLARELANESCQSRGEEISIIKVNNCLRPISLLVLDTWYASEITFKCINIANEGNFEHEITPNNLIKLPKNTSVPN